MSKKKSGKQAEKMDTYECLSCKRTALVEEGQSVPRCCGKPMKKLPREICLQSSHSEAARPMDNESACDDFRGVK